MKVYAVGLEKCENKDQLKNNLAACAKRMK